MFSRSRRLGVRLDHVAQLPADGIGRDGLLQPANPARRHGPLQQAAHDAADADIHFQHHHDVAPVLVADLHGEIVHAHHFAAVGIDDLLVQQVAGDAQHVFVVVVGGELLVAELDAALGRDRADLVVADDQPCIAAAHQVAVDAGGMFQRDQGGVFHTPDAATLEVEHRHARQFGKEQQVVRHRNRPSPDTARALNGPPELCLRLRSTRP